MMTSSIRLPQDAMWSVQDWLFDWVLRQMADRMSGLEARRLMEIVNEHLGWFDIAEVTRTDATLVRELLRELPARADQEFPAEMVGRTAAIAALGRLADLAGGVRGDSRGDSD